MKKVLADADSQMMAGRSVLLSLAVAIAAFVATHLLSIPGSVHQLMAATGGLPIFDMQPSFSPDEVYERLVAFGANGRALYSRTLVTTDVVFPLCVLAFLYLFARYIAQRTGAPAPLRLLLLALPFAYFLADMTENATIYLLLSDFPQRHETAAGGLGYVTLIKRVTQIAAILLPSALLILGIARRHARVH